MTVGIVSHNGRDRIHDCVASVLGQDYTGLRAMLVDVASDDGTADYVRTHFPQVEIVRCPENRGPSPARNLAIQRASTDLVLLVDDDAVLRPDCLRRLVEAARIYTDGAVWAPRVVYYKQPEIIQTEGGRIHFVSEAILLNPGRPVEEGLDRVTRIETAAGTCLLVSKPAWRHIGGFDEDYFFGRTDGEFTFRLTIAGYGVYTVPTATCLHKVKTRGFTKLYYQVRNRWYFTLSLYSTRSLIVLAPALLVHELLLILFLAKSGVLGPYLRAMARVVAELPVILRKRRAIQRLRRVSDRDILTCGPINVRADLMQGRSTAIMKRALEMCYQLYWSMAAPLLGVPGDPEARRSHSGPEGLA